MDKMAFSKHKASPPDEKIAPPSLVESWVTNAPVGFVALDEKGVILHINPQGEIAGVYDKQHLVPFGEFIPFGGFLKRWIPYLGQLGTFNSGKGPVVFDVNGVKVAPNICYEAIFSSLIQRSVHSGADVIVNITNDGWFLDTAAPEQHFVANRFRAVETGRPVVRAANTGISAVIDSAGKTVFQSPLLVSGAYVVEVPRSRESTFFSMLYSRLCPAN